MLKMIKKGVDFVCDKAKQVYGRAKTEVQFGVGTAVATVGSAAHADTVDATAIVSIITGAVTTISAVGLAVLSLVTTIKLFKWVQRVL